MSTLNSKSLIVTFTLGIIAMVVSMRTGRPVLGSPHTLITDRLGATDTESDDSASVDLFLAERLTFDVRFVPGIEQQRTKLGHGITRRWVSCPWACW